MIGTDHNNLSWKNTHKRGSTLMLMVQDSKSNSGGIDTPLYNVTAGNDTSCLSHDTQTPTIASITPNVTGKLESCEPWGLAVAGGKAPYTIILTALNSLNATNVTTDGNGNYTYINRVPPNELLMASVADADGIWGTSTPVILSHGSNVTDCPVSNAFVTTSTRSTPTISPTQTKPALQRQHDHENRTLIIGVSVGVGILVALAFAALLWWFCRRGARRGRGTWDADPNHCVVQPWRVHEVSESTDMQEGHFAPRSLLPSTPFSRPIYNLLQASLGDMDAIAAPGAMSTGRQIERAPAILGMNYRSGSANTASFTPSLSTARERKLTEAYGQHLRTSGSFRGPHAVSSLVPSSSSSFSNLNHLVDVTPELGSQPNIIIQHQDGGTTGIVQELPPPYVDRTGR
ncbi:hypothetical protein BDY19DRAFT_105519 [Irpex rosettiformis]|uniref:Uncharacterized protein n=1 Tax=Irpex rosettiformis TaxID=378272 RepID=A0ACB8U5E2_9APHY|nr:hypothetical protein BDY19DRAFT_105519 [Irpex rosettiformis]